MPLPFNSNIATAQGSGPSPRQLGERALARQVAFKLPSPSLTPAKSAVALPGELATPANTLPTTSTSTPTTALPVSPTPVLPSTITPSAQLPGVMATALGMATEDTNPLSGIGPTTISPFTGTPIPVIHVSGANVVDEGSEWSTPTFGSSSAGAPPPTPRAEPSAPPLVAAPPTPKKSRAALWLGVAVLAVLLFD